MKENVHLTQTMKGLSRDKGRGYDIAWEKERDEEGEIETRRGYRVRIEIKEKKKRAKDDNAVRKEGPEGNRIE